MNASALHFRVRACTNLYTYGYFDLYSSARDPQLPWVHPELALERCHILLPSKCQYILMLTRPSILILSCQQFLRVTYASLFVEEAGRNT